MKKLYAIISNKTFYNIIHRAKCEGISNEKGFIDLEKLFNIILESYANGTYIIRGNHGSKKDD